MSDTFEIDAPEMNRSSAGVKMLRERLEQQNREVHTHLAPPLLAAASLLLDCTHLGCVPIWQHGVFHCACHGGEFDGDGLHKEYYKDVTHYMEAVPPAPPVT
jgi:hypothetical protein